MGVPREVERGSCPENLLKMMKDSRNGPRKFVNAMGDSFTEDV